MHIKPETRTVYFVWTCKERDLHFLVVRTENMIALVVMGPNSNDVGFGRQTTDKPWTVNRNIYWLLPPSRLTTQPPHPWTHNCQSSNNFSSAATQRGVGSWFRITIRTDFSFQQPHTHPLFRPQSHQSLVTVVGIFSSVSSQPVVSFAWLVRIEWNAVRSDWCAKLSFRLSAPPPKMDYCCRRVWQTVDRSPYPSGMHSDSD